MNREVDRIRPDVDDEDIIENVDDSMAETVVLPESTSTDNVGDASVEINVEALIADIEGTEDKVSERKKEVRKKLDELAEKRSLEDTYAIEFDED